MAKNKSTTHIDKLGTYETFRAPWESEAGGDADVDKPTLKRLVYNLKKDLATARDANEDVKADLAEVEAERDTAKEEAADANGTEAQKKIDKLQKQVDDLTAERDGLAKEKEVAEVRKEVLADFEAKYPKAAKYVKGETQEELEASLAEVAEDWGIDLDGDGSDGDDEVDDEPVVRTTPRTRSLANPADKANGRGAEQEIDFEKVSSEILAGGSIFR